MKIPGDEILLLNTVITHNIGTVNLNIPVHTVLNQRKANLLL